MGYTPAHDHGRADDADVRRVCVVLAAPLVLRVADEDRRSK
jgi:hypothetical protein